MMTNPRHEYLRAGIKKQDITSPNIRKGLDKYVNQGVLNPEIQNSIFLNPSPPTMYYSSSSNRQYSVSTHMNYIVPQPSSMYTNTLKSIAVGKSAYKVGLPIEAPISTKCYYPSGTRTSLRRARSGGCVAPKKKGAIENYSLRDGQICAWGSLPRQNY
jgi:hypothetical protein